VCEFFFSGSFSTSRDVTVYLKVGAQLLVLKSIGKRQEALLAFQTSGDGTESRWGQY
jgi:hypothetical protein